MRQSWETMTSVSAGHIILTPTQPLGSGRPQRESSPGPPHQESRALPQSYRAPFGYSTKNIPICSEKQYLKTFIDKTEKFVKNLRRRAFFFLNPKADREEKETFGFNSTRPPPHILELKTFEEGLASMITNIKFRRTKNHFQYKLRNNIKKINNDNHLFIPADKTSDFYKLSKDQYEGLINKSIHKKYKKSSEATVREVTKEDRRIATKLELSDRIDVTAKREAFITLKDHKPNFRNKPTCTLINLCKPELGKVSKQLVEKIVYDVKTVTNIKHLKSTNDVVNWFHSIENKANTCSYPLISAISIPPSPTSF